MKKALVLLLSGLLLFALVACGTAGSEAPAGGTSGAGTTTPAADGDIYEIVMMFPTLGTTPTDLPLVEAAINELVEPELGVRISFYPVSAFEANNTTNLMVSSGEKLDLMISIFEGGVGSYVNKGILLELDDLVAQYGQDIVAAEGVAMSGGYFNGVLYAVPTEEKMGRVKGFRARADILEKYNIEVDPDHIYTLEELTDIFATIKAGEGDRFYMVAANANEEMMFSSFDMYDTLGSTTGSGVIMNYGTDGTTIVNYYETEEFAHTAAVARQWFEAGYYSQDANTTTDAGLTLFQGGNYLGFFSNSEPDMIANHTQTARAYLDTDTVTLFTSAPSALTQHYQITMWALPITCENPEKTMQFLNMMYASEELVNLLYRGIEGTHYSFVEGAERVVEYPEGIDGMNTPYIAILNVWGDKMKDYVMSPLDDTYYTQMEEFNSSILPQHTSSFLGYCFDSEPVKTQYAAVSDVITQYEASLGLGVVDPDEMIPEFLDKLEAAGINTVIAENQRQLDAWLAANG